MKTPPSTDDIAIPVEIIAGAYPSIANVMRTGTPAQVDEVRRAATHYQREFVRARTKGAQPAGIAAGQHELCDRAMNDMLAHKSPNITISCREGCSHCCYQPVYITDQEAQLLTMAVEDAGVRFDYDRAARQALWTDDTWRQQPHAERACGFLTDDGRCGVYEHRPLVCRKVLVRSDPELCDTVLKPGGAVVMVASISAEVITAAAHVATEGGSLAHQMLIARGMP
jgi:hypothetical protein